MSIADRAESRESPIEPRLLLVQVRFRIKTGYFRLGFTLLFAAAPSWSFQGVGQDPPPETPRSVVVSWEPLPDPRLAYYRIDYCEWGDPISQQIETPNASALIERLDPTAIYRFSVRAVNRYGLESDATPEVVWIQEAPREPENAGDLDDDGERTVCDLVAFQTRPADIEQWPQWRRDRADGNLDGVLNHHDRELLIRKILDGPGTQGLRAPDTPE